MDHFCKFFSYSEADLNDICIYVKPPQKFMKRAEQNKDVNFTIFEKSELVYTDKFH